LIEADIDPDVLLDALDRLVVRKRPLSLAPIEKLKREISAELTTHLSMARLIEALIDAGYGLREIHDFLIDVGIIHDEEEWTRVRPILHVVVLQGIARRRAEEGR